METTRIMILLALSVFTSQAVAGDIGDVFSKDVFGVAWGSTLDEVQRKFPGGETKIERGTPTYTVKDGRVLFGLRRNPENFIKFSFNGNGLVSGVGIQFPVDNPDMVVVLLNKLTSHFGDFTVFRTIMGTTHAAWPEDDGVIIGFKQAAVVGSNEDLMVFTVGYQAQDAHEVSRAQLGF